MKRKEKKRKEKKRKEKKRKEKKEEKFESSISLWKEAKKKKIIHL